MFRDYSYEKRGRQRRSELYGVIDKAVYERYLERRGQRIALHDCDLRRWALQVAQQHQLDGFKASPTWLYEFKVCVVY